MRYWYPLEANPTVTYSLPQPENDSQHSGNSVRSCIFGNEGIMWIFAHITDILTACKGKNTIYQRYNTDSKLIDIVHCKTYENSLLNVENAILVRYY